MNVQTIIKNNSTINKQEQNQGSGSNQLNYCKLSFIGDIKVNPDPAICDPYSQGNVNAFGENTDWGCVLMTLCCLIIAYAGMIQCLIVTAFANIRNLGNEFYNIKIIQTALSVILTELSAIVALEYIDYSLLFSEMFPLIVSYSTVFAFVFILGSDLQYNEIYSSLEYSMAFT